MTVNKSVDLLTDWIRKNIMQSVRGKYTVYFVTGMLLSAALIGGSSALIMHRKVVSDTAIMMNLRCREYGEFASRAEANGLPLDLGEFIQDSDDETLYADGSLFLVTADDDILYPDYTSSKGFLDISDSEATMLLKKLDEKNSGDSLISYRFEGIDKRMAYCSLDNGTKLVLVAEAADIYAEQDFLVLMILLITISSAVFFAILCYGFTRRLAIPLEQLTVAAQQIADGNMDVEIPERTEEDEVGNLTRSFQITVIQLKRYIHYVQGLAYTDALTQVSNKAAYDRMAMQLDADITAGTAEFAILMIDLNFLKRVNDTYGHEKGNLYIQGLCERILNIFPLEDVYRIGGDEFVVVLSGEYYRERDGLVGKLKRSFANVSGSEDGKPTEKPWENISAAVGLAVYEKDSDRTVEDVFKRADELMYQDKVAMKGARE